MSIREFFAGKTVAVTGVTGFVGQCLVEKLLRSCPEIKRIYALIRSNKSQSAEERLVQLLKLQVFNRIQDGQLQKVVAIPSDLSSDELGIDENMRDILAGEIQVFFHCAATLRFNEPLRVAYKINTLAVKNIVKLCHNSKHLQAFVHVSTAYSYCERDDIGEEIYPTGWNSDELFKSMSWMKEETVAKLLPDILHKRPNTYTLTKAFGEEILVREAVGLPCCVVRPSIIGATYSEPIPGWCTNLNGATGIIVGYGKGLLHTLHAHRNTKLDIIPVDFVVNGIIAAAWKTAHTHMSNKLVGKATVTSQPTTAAAQEHGQVLVTEENEEIKKRRKDIPVYNLVTGTDNPVTLQEWNSIIITAFSDYPLDKVYSAPSVTLVSNKYLHRIVAFMVHNVPAGFFDLALMSVGKKPRLFRLARRMKLNIEVIQYFLTQHWNWKNDNVLRLRSEMTKSDQKEFDFNTRSISWKYYMDVYARGTKEFLLKEDLNGYPAARRHLRRLRILGYGLQIIIFITAWRLIVPRTLIAKNAWHLFISLWFKFIRFFQISSTVHPRSFFARLLSS